MGELERQRAIHLRLSGMPQARGGRSPALPTGFPSLDRALGIGGLPRGSIVEIFGPASSGKTALALQCIARAQRDGAAAAWIDADRAFDAAFAAQLGVDVARLPVAVPATAEEALEMARQFAASDAIDLVAIDSAAALVPRLEMEAGIGSAGAGLQTRVLSTELRRLSRMAARSRACIVFLSQMRVRLGSPGEIETSSGGPPLKLYAALRMALAATGRLVRFRILKNRFAAPFAAGELEWQPGSGFREAR